ncbi:ubiquitin-conjugating enzyme E2 R2-like isoform X1 [Aythya fuligula]|uniref:Ubiquitin-conjugating enzyme E2 R2-like isoform X1 n=2 Tax=Aythya fuligula TaxID=219594 RepID=A0A6J3ELL1_AYTFU|nr:ubiquitin-conjugating enzyme E2 R2-like isoform X1 [Aythya fuligula]
MPSFAYLLIKIVENYLPLNGKTRRMDDRHNELGQDFKNSPTLFGSQLAKELEIWTTQGQIQAHIKFPIDYPYSPPTFRFLTKMWHPNVYENGDVCISILHPPVDDPQSGELPSERWNPTQNVRTILLSVISLLNEPNTFSPANVDASVMFRKWRDSKGKDKEYAEIIRKQVLATKAEAEKDGVKVPTTLAEYCIKTKVPSTDNSSDLLYDDLYDDDIDDEDEEEEDAECYDDDDSGNEES